MRAPALICATLLTVLSADVTLVSAQVTSVGITVPSFLTASGSPITTSGTIAITAPSQSANRILASPSGASGAPSFRALTTTDLPQTNTWAGLQTFQPSTSGLSSVVIPAGAAPTSPANGALWSTTKGFYGAANGVTQRLQGAVWSMPTDPQFGAKCDGSTDDTTALQAWAASATAGGHLRLPNSACVFKSPIAFPQGIDNVMLSGAGRQSQLLYAGTATTGTLVKIGGTTLEPNLCSVLAWSVHDLKIASNTVMTGGDGLLIQNTCEMDFDNIAVGGDIDGNQNLFNGIHFSGGNSLHLRGYSFASNNIAEIVNGSVDRDQQLTDIYQIQGKISHSKIGLNIAGNAGGVVIDQSDYLLNGTNVQVDQSVVSSPNTQIFFGSGFASDLTDGVLNPSSTLPNIGINITDPGRSDQSMLFFSGSWLASAIKVSGVANSGTCLHIASTAANWGIHLSGGTVINCNADGILNESATARLTVSGTYISSSGRYGINSSVANPQMSFVGIVWPNAYGINLSGNLGGNANLTGITNNSPLWPAQVITGTATGAGPSSQLLINDPNNTNGAGIWLNGNGATTPTKFIRAFSGHLQVLNSNYSAVIMDLSDGAILNVGGYQAGGVAGVSCSGPPTASFAVNSGIVTHC